MRLRRLGGTAIGIAAVGLVAAVALRGPDAAVGDDPLPPGSYAVADKGAWYFRSEGFGGLAAGPLETHAVPWKLVAAALVLDARRGAPDVPLSAASLRSILSRYGFLYPRQIGNWPATLPVPATGPLPLGMTHGTWSPVRGLSVAIANLGCAACHAGTTYATDGRATPDRAWLGMPNASLDLEGYTRAVFDALRRQARTPETLLAATATLFPDMSARERFALRRLVLPRVRNRLEALAGQDRPLPFPNGLPGSTNGVAALKMALGAPLAGNGAGELGFVSIPDLGERAWRRSLLVDGAYAAPGGPPDTPTSARDLTPAHRDAHAAIATFFTVPSMGVHPDRAYATLPRMRDTLAFLSGYRAQPFPGKVDAASAAAGERVYAGACAACHGTYSAHPDPRLTGFPNWIGEVGTDPLRASLFDSALVTAVGRSAYRDRIAARRTGRYAAPPLAGVWASAPYLHNGSVPTIAALLDPARRPVRFQTGGHALDFAALGLRLGPDGRYPADVHPWSRPGWIDTRRPGLSNGGHVFGSDLTAGQKRQLIEYLKLL